MNVKQPNALLIFIISLLSSFSLSTVFVYGQADSFTTISATVKLNICGDGIVEGPEDCEGEDLNGRTCQLLGFGGGDLSCDIACSFDTKNCIAPTPTPSPTPGPTPTSNPFGPENATDLDVELSLNPPTVPFTSNNIVDPTKPGLPSALQYFDLRGIGRILLSDLRIVVQMWVDEWKKTLAMTQNPNTEIHTGKCDLNNDGKCDLRDFSILMFYIDN
jgi:hypothetical protein